MDERTRSYQAGGRIARERMAKERPLDAAALDAVTRSDIVVVTGTYDHVEQVLGALGLPFTTVRPEHVAALQLRAEQLLVVNCPGHLGDGGVDAVRRFVEAGGSLFSTDWALTNLVQQAFPRTIRHNGVSTGDDVVRVDHVDHDNPFLDGVLDGDDDPQWWLEGSSHPIRILDPDRVQVLLSSAELGRRYGEGAVAVTFRWGDQGGEVFHMISHYYLQRTELRTARHRQAASAYAFEKGVADGADLRDLRVGDVESAATSSRLFANVVAAKKRAASEARAGDAAGAAVPRPLDLFVYGTLQPGEPRYAPLAPLVESAHRSRVLGRLYDTGNGFPAARFGKGHPIDGWVLRVKAGRERRAVRVLDEIGNGLFRRANVETVRGRPVVASEWAGSVDGLSELLPARWPVGTSG